MLMREAVAVALAAACLVMPGSPLAAQRTADRPILIFTISGAYLDDVGLWSVPDQPVTDPAAVTRTDHFALTRSVKRTIGAGFAGTYYKGSHLGITGEAFLLGLGYDDTCRLVAPAQSALNVDRCNSIDERERSAAAVALTTGLIYRVTSDEFISPFARVTAGILVNNQSPLRLFGRDTNGDELLIYDDENTGTRLRPALVLGIGTTVAAGRAYQIRWEVRDNIVGIQKITGPGGQGQVPPNETVYKHIFSINVGLDVILERRPGRRY
jgi:hypothetical protein